MTSHGGLKALGHPISASGLRMLYGEWLQLRDEAPGECVSFVGSELGS